MAGHVGRRPFAEFAGSRERRAPAQRLSPRDPDRGGGERCAPGGVRRAGESARARRQHLQGAHLPRPARHAGRLRRHRTGSGRIPARFGRGSPERPPPPGSAGSGRRRQRSGRHLARRSERSERAPRHRRPPSPGAGHRGAGSQGSDRRQGRPPHHPPLDSFALPRVHAPGRRDRHFPAHRGPRGAGPPSIRDAQADGPRQRSPPAPGSADIELRGAGRRLHRADRGRIGGGEHARRGHGLSSTDCGPRCASARRRRLPALSSTRTCLS